MSTNEQIIERLATEVMEWEKKPYAACESCFYWHSERDHEPAVWCGCDMELKVWNPLTDWNHWRQVEEKVMEDKEMFDAMVGNCLKDSNSVMRLYDYCSADLPTRCKALLAALDSLSSHES